MIGTSFTKELLREKCPNTELFLVRIFPHLGWIRTRNYSVSPYSAQMWGNTDQKWLRIWTVFTQWVKKRILNEEAFQRFHLTLLWQRPLSEYNKGHFLWSFTQKCVEITLLLGKRALFVKYYKRQCPTTGHWFLLDYSLVII